MMANRLPLVVPATLQAYAFLRLLLSETTPSYDLSAASTQRNVIALLSAPSYSR
jgi:hypothetical protein